jgi:aldose 1-epimerase
MIELQAGTARAVILPDMGGGLAGLWLADRPILRPWRGERGDGPFSLALNLLAPFSNRIRGGFAFDGRRHDLTPNLAGEPYPIHGDAFQRSWDVAVVDRESVTLGVKGSFGPFVYDGMVTYHLWPDSLTVRLGIVSRADIALPYGLGFHPWFPRLPETRLRFKARGVWLEDQNHMPAGLAPAPVPPEWDFETSRPLPQGWINNAFSGWDGQAMIMQGSSGITVTIETDDADHAVLYSPSATAEFFCFEPVTHPVDAHNLPGRPGLRTLNQGESLEISMSLRWDPA